MCGAVRAPPGLISVCSFIQPQPRFGRSCPVSGPAGSGTPSSGTALAPLLQLGVPSTLLLLPNLGTLGLLWLPASRGCSRGAEERQQGGFGQDTPCHVPLASLQDDERLAGPITEPPWGRMGPPAPVPFTCPFPSPNHAPMGAPQTPQEPGTPSPALTRLLQGGEMRTSPLPNEIRWMSCCSWPPRIIASS